VDRSYQGQCNHQTARDSCASQTMCLVLFLCASIFLVVACTQGFFQLLLYPQRPLVRRHKRDQDGLSSHQTNFHARVGPVIGFSINFPLLLPPLHQLLFLFPPAARTFDAAHGDALALFVGAGCFARAVHTPAGRNAGRAGGARWWGPGMGCRRWHSTGHGESRQGRGR